MAKESAARTGRAAPLAPALRGLAAAPGKATGRARVICSPSELRRLQSGDVLVVPTAEQRWLGDLGGLAAVVSDVGGLLSRGAAALRRARRPAVFGTGRATAVLRDGMLIEVDGDAGLVRMLDADGA